MTYQDVLDDLIDLLNKHKMIQSVGYGNLSDLMEPLKRDPKTNQTGATRKPDKIYRTDYPYAFINPTNHTLSKNQSTYRFNLIMMEQCTDDTREVIQAQSECHQYIKDVLAHLYYHYGEKYDFNLNSNVTPFKEKYNDTVSGMTAAIEVIIRDPLDDCITPFNPDAVPYIWKTNSVNSVMGEDPFELVNMYFDTTINAGNGEFTSDIAFSFAEDTKIRVEYEYSYSYSGSGSIPYPPLIYQGFTSKTPTKLEGWPTDPQPNTTYNIKAEFEFQAQAGLFYAYRLNTDGVSSEDMNILAGNSVKIYKL